jgi:transposase
MGRVAELFRISPSSIVKWSQRYRQTGSAAAKSMGRVRRAVLAAHPVWLLERIKQKPQLTLQAIRIELAERRVIVSLWAVQFLGGMGILSLGKHHLQEKPDAI